jgi:hypothetical protein
MCCTHIVVYHGEIGFLFDLLVWEIERERNALSGRYSTTPSAASRCYTAGDVDLLGASSFEPRSHREQRCVMLAKLEKRCHSHSMLEAGQSLFSSSPHRDLLPPASMHRQPDSTRAARQIFKFTASANVPQATLLSQLVAPCVVARWARPSRAPPRHAHHGRKLASSWPSAPLPPSLHSLACFSIAMGHRS